MDDHINYLFKHSIKFDIDLSTFNLEKMLELCKPSVVKLILSNKKIASHNLKNIKNLTIIAQKEKRFDNLILFNHQKNL